MAKRLSIEKTSAENFQRYWYFLILIMAYEGVKYSGTNKNGDRRGMGRRKVSKQGPEKRPKHWNPEHRDAFIKGRKSSERDLAFCLH